MNTNRATKEDIDGWLKPTLQKEGLETYNINICGSSEKGENYLGEITFVKVCGRTKENDEKVYNFVIKCAKKSKEFRKAMPIKEAFENEIHVYDKILPTFSKFQLEKKIQKPFKNTAKCYDTIALEDMEVLIFEDMKEKGYSLHNRRLPMDRHLIKAVIENYGKLHAISFALRDQKPATFNKLTDKLQDVYKLITAKHESMPKDFNLYEHVIKRAEEQNEHRIVEKCFLLNKKARVMNDLTDPTDPYAVILHGDCWNNNFLFKYTNEHEDSVPEVCFLDFQLSRLASPVYDLSYFLFTCLSEDDVQNFDKINEWYYESFSNNLREMGSDPNKLFPREELMNQWNKFGLFGLIMMPSIIKICLSDIDEVPDLVEAAETGADLASMWGKGIRSSDQLRKRTLPIMQLAIDKNLI